MSTSAEAIEPSILREVAPLTPGPHPHAFRALTPNGQPVLLKRFSLVTAADWKAYELFEREARALQQLDHPRLPRLLAYGEDGEGIYLISSWIVGISLAEQLELGRRWSEPELLDLARQLLELLVWLHARQPAMIHRDIKPANLIVNTAGELFLIDFGSVLLRLDPSGGSTVAGTFGYMAPEQLSGRALPASDLYALGATLIHLLSGTAPAEMPQERLQLRFEPYLSCSDALSRWLRRLLAPIPEDRFASAVQALTALERLGVSQIPAVALAELTLQPPPDLVAALIRATPAGVGITLPESPLGARALARWGRRRTRAGVLLVVAAVSPALPIWPLFLLGAVGGGLYDGWRLLRLGARLELRLDAYGLEITFWRGQRRLHQLQIVRADVLSAALVSTKMGQMLELVYLDGFGARRRCPLAIDADPALAGWLARQLETWRSGPEASRPVLSE